MGVTLFLSESLLNGYIRLLEEEHQVALLCGILGEKKSLDKLSDIQISLWIYKERVHISSSKTN